MLVWRRSTWAYLEVLGLSFSSDCLGSILGPKRTNICLFRVWFGCRHSLDDHKHELLFIHLHIIRIFSVVNPFD